MSHPRVQALEDRRDSRRGRSDQPETGTNAAGGAGKPLGIEPRLRMAQKDRCQEGPLAVFCGHVMPGRGVFRPSILIFVPETKTKIFLGSGTQ